MENIIINFIKKHKFSYLIGILFMFLASFIQTLFPKILGKTIDILKVNNFNKKLVITNIFFILLIALGTFLSTYIWRNMVIGNSRKIECCLREKLYDHFQQISSEFYSKRKTGDLIAYAINDISAVRMTFGPATAMSINGVVICAFSIYSMIKAINFKLTLMALLPVPFIIFFMLKAGKIIQKRFKKVQESFSDISGKVDENINGIRVIKSYVQEDSEVKSFEKLSGQMMDANIDMVKISSILSPSIELCFSISFVLNLIIGGNMVLKGTISLGDFTAFNGYIIMIMKPVISIGRIINILQRGMSSYKRLDEIFDIKPAVYNEPNAISGPIEGNIRYNHLYFSYPESDKNVLSDINIDIKRGQAIGIVGKTGSGKSTLVSLLLRLYNANKGELIIDGIDIKDYKIENIRDTFGYVPQDNFIFSASIKDNIKSFKNSYTDEQVENAAKISCIYDSIIKLKNGFDSIVGERGVNLSGGQKQRLCIARAIIKNPDVLILDDSLSAVDTITESKIIGNIKNIRKNKTSIIIAHRISAIKDADEIIVLNNGSISERGSHEELLKKRGFYYETFRKQS